MPKEQVRRQTQNAWCALGLEQHGAHPWGEEEGNEQRGSESAAKEREMRARRREALGGLAGSPGQAESPAPCRRTPGPPRRNGPYLSDRP